MGTAFDIQAAMAAELEPKLANTKLAAKPTKIAKNNRLEEWMIEVFSRALKKGHTVGSAADLIQVPMAKIREWMARAEEPDAPEIYVRFASSACHARANRVDELLGMANVHAAASPQMCLELLKISNSEFNVAKKMDVQAGPRQTEDLSGFSYEELEAYKALKTKALRSGE